MNPADQDWAACHDLARQGIFCGHATVLALPVSRGPARPEAVAMVASQPQVSLAKDKRTAPQLYMRRRGLGARTLSKARYSELPARRHSSLTVSVSEARVSSQ